MVPILFTTAPIALDQLPLRPSSLQVWRKHGFLTTKEVGESQQSGITNLAAELQMTENLQQAAELLQEVEDCIASATSNKNSSNGLVQPSQTAADLVASYRKSSSNSSLNHHNRHIITFCRDVDVLLGGGLALGELTEIAGPPGVGKTQLAMQLAVNTCLPVEYGGVAGQCIYIDTEGSLAPERCHSMAQALLQHIQAGRRRKRKRMNQQLPNLPSWFTVEGILQSIHTYRVHDYGSQCALLQSLPDIVQELNTNNSERPVRLVILDSMAFHHRTSASLTTLSSNSNNSNDAKVRGTNTPTNHKSDYFVARHRALTQQAHHLAALASRFQLAVVAINQMTTKLVVDSKTGATNATLVPALGEAWAHAVTTRLQLEDSNESSSRNVRRLQLVKSPRLPPQTARFQVVADGIRGVESNGGGGGQQ